MPPFLLPCFCMPQPPNGGIFFCHVPSAGGANNRTHLPPSHALLIGIPNERNRPSASQCSDVTSAFWRNGASGRWDSCHATLPPSRGIGCHGTLIRSAVARPHTRARVPKFQLH